VPRRGVLQVKETQRRFASVRDTLWSFGIRYLDPSIKLSVIISRAPHRARSRPYRVLAYDLAVLGHDGNAGAIEREAQARNARGARRREGRDEIRLHQTGRLRRGPGAVARGSSTAVQSAARVES
jgi:hypothetical protein